jgi:WD40 repeat protein
VWDALTGKEKHVLNGHTDSVNSVAFSSDGSHIVSGSSDNSVRVWDALTGKEKHVLNGHTLQSTQLHFQVMAATLSLAQMVTDWFGCGMP